MSKGGKSDEITCSWSGATQQGKEQEDAGRCGQAGAQLRSCRPGSCAVIEARGAQPPPRALVIAMLNEMMEGRANLEIEGDRCGRETRRMTEELDNMRFAVANFNAVAAGFRGDVTDAQEKVSTLPSTLPARWAPSKPKGRLPRRRHHLEGALKL